MRTGWKLVPTKTRLEVMLSFFPPLDVLHSARLPLNGGSPLGHLARLLARDGVTSRRSVITEPRPLYPQKRTYSRRVGMSALCHSHPNAPQQTALSFEHLARARHSPNG